MIAAVCSWHEHHEAAANDMERRLAGRAKMIVAAPSDRGVRFANLVSRRIDCLRKRL